MGYLHPPPGDAPVIVMKDFGGDVREYAAVTNAYIDSGREVRLHECRSACTLALAVPNVCVYPDSVLRFHKAYNPITRGTNEAVSSAMLAAYPPAVRERLGVLSRQYKSLTGSELIRLGVRDCNSPAQPKVLIAHASAHGGAGNALANAFNGLMAGGFGSPQIPVYSGYSAPVRVKPVKVEAAEAVTPPADAPPTEAPASAGSAAAPFPPPRPDELSPEATQSSEARTAPVEAAAREPSKEPSQTPSYRPFPPPSLPSTASNWGAPISGSAQVLASARFAPFPYRLTRI
jgi:hypothetical protein